jgi:hypothetical protein
MLIRTELMIYIIIISNVAYKVTCLLLNGHMSELFVEIGEILID